MIKKILSFSEAIWGSFKLWLNGDVVLASAQQRFKRVATCAMCVNLKKGICQECGCFIKLKTRLAFCKCPIDKW